MNSQQVIRFSDIPADAIIQDEEMDAKEKNEDWMWEKIGNAYYPAHHISKEPEPEEPTDN